MKFTKVLLPIVSSLVPAISLCSCANANEEKEFRYDKVYEVEQLVNEQFNRETGYYEQPLDPNVSTAKYLEITSQNHLILIEDIIESISKINTLEGSSVGKGQVGVTVDEINTEKELLSLTLGLNCNISCETTSGDEIILDFKYVELKIVNLPCLVHPQGEQTEQPWRWDVSIRESRWTKEDIDWSIYYSGATMISLNGVGINVDKTITLNEDVLDDSPVKDLIIYVFVQYVFFKSWYLSHSEPTS